MINIHYFTYHICIPFYSSPELLTPLCHPVQLWLWFHTLTSPHCRRGLAPDPDVEPHPAGPPGEVSGGSRPLGSLPWVLQICFCPVPSSTPVRRFLFLFDCSLVIFTINNVNTIKTITPISAFFLSSRVSRVLFKLSQVWSFHQCVPLSAVYDFFFFYMQQSPLDTRIHRFGPNAVWRCFAVILASQWYYSSSLFLNAFLYIFIVSI